MLIHHFFYKTNVVYNLFFTLSYTQNNTVKQ